MPKAIPMGREIISEKMLIYSDTGILSTISSQTGTFMDSFRDTPQSQLVTTSLRKMAYWVRIGLSR